MSSLLKTQFKKVIITPEQEIVFKKGGSDDGSKNSTDALDITPAVVAFDYYEDLLSPSITVNLKISNTSGLYSLVPVSYTHPPSPRDLSTSRMPSSA